MASFTAASRDSLAFRGLACCKLARRGVARGGLRSRVLGGNQRPGGFCGCGSPRLCGFTRRGCLGGFFRCLGVACLLGCAQLRGLVFRGLRPRFGACAPAAFFLDALALALQRRIRLRRSGLLRLARSR